MPSLKAGNLNCTPPPHCILPLPCLLDPESNCAKPGGLIHLAEVMGKGSEELVMAPRVSDGKLRFGIRSTPCWKTTGRRILALHEEGRCSQSRTEKEGAGFLRGGESPITGSIQADIRNLLRGDVVQGFSECFLPASESQKSNSARNNRASFGSWLLLRGYIPLILPIT